ncbi:hypothetical protein C2E23DRAFT_889588 [Lenzites betulinus]|nr:hypothetical protein C2E23DRAFT_889588 [Lenzites betulinus]
MALVVSSSSVDTVRRSPRIRRQFPRVSHNGISPSLLSVSVPAILAHASSRREQHRSRSRVSTAPSPSPSSRHRPRPVAAPAVPVRAGTKRKRPTKGSDVSDHPRYKLVLGAPHSVEPSQTPRQLRYAKRQRLLVAPQGINLPAPSVEHLPLLSGSLQGQENVPHPPHHLHDDGDDNVVSLLPEPVSVPVANVTNQAECPQSHRDGPVFTPFYRTPVYWRQRTPDSTDPMLWKSACQERVEYLKSVYCDIVRAVVQAEIAAAAAQAAAAVAEAPAPIPDIPVQDEPATIPTQFEHYDPSQNGSVDADGDIDMDAVDDDEEEEEDEDEDATGEDEVPETVYEQVLVLEPPPPAPPRAHRPRLPRLSSIRVSSLEPYPSPTTKDGVPFVGRGTPADPMRLAEWAAPALPLPPQTSSPQSWSPEPLYFTPDMVPPPPLPVSVGYDMDVTANAMAWLDPVLHPPSVSPSPSPVPNVIPGAFVFTDLSVPQPQPSFSGALAMVPSAPLSPTGCALHESFLECLQGTGCAGPGLGAGHLPPSSSSPFFISPPAAPAVPELTSVFAPPPPAVFPNQELAQFVRSHLVPGSVSLSHALG